MYICNNCQQCSKPGEKTETIVLETRPKTYTNTIKVWDKKLKRPIKQAKTSEGFEIVREVKVCSACKDKFYTADYCGLKLPPAQTVKVKP